MQWCIHPLCMILCKNYLFNQAIPGLVRFNTKGQLVSSDLSDYIKFRCEGDGAARSCEINQSNLDIWDFGALLYPASTESIHSYAAVRLFGVRVCPLLSFHSPHLFLRFTGCVVVWIHRLGGCGLARYIHGYLSDRSTMLLHRMQCCCEEEKKTRSFAVTF